MGFSFRESAAAAAVATIIFRDGTSTAGDLVVVEEFAGNRGITHWFGPLGIEMEDGIFLDRIAGQTKGSVWTG